MFVDNPASVTITNELGQSRTLHPDGKDDTIEIQGVPVAVMTRRDGESLVVTYRHARNREFVYTYTVANGALSVSLEVVDHGSNEKARRVYASGVDVPAPKPSTSPTGNAGSAAGSATGSGTAPKSEPFDQRPGAELRGLKNLGVVVEELSTAAGGCGLNREAMETSLAKRLTDAGLTVRKNSDEDTYVYVNVQTTLSSGTCMSRYDVFLYSYATARLSYREQPVLVQASLAHRGGIAASGSALHGSMVTRGLEQYVDLVITQIRDANR